MKKAFAAVAGVILFFSAKAQSFEIGGRYLAESNWFFNSNITNSGSTSNSIEENYSAVYSYAYGFHLAYNITDHSGLECDIQIGNLSQNYNGTFPGAPSGSMSGGAYLPDTKQLYYYNETYKSNITVNTLQIPLVYRFLAGNGEYFGLGPQVDLVENAQYSASYVGGPVQNSSSNVKSDYASSFYSVVLSFGNNIRLSHSLFFNINLRFAYDLSDMKGSDAVGQNLGNNILYSGSQPFYPKYQATNAVMAGFGVALLYRIGHDF